MQRIDAVLPHILSIEAYAEVVHEIPYTYELSGERGSVMVIGVNHVHRLDHPAFTLIDQVFEHTEPDLLCVEGMDNDFKEPLARQLLATLSPEVAAERGGEAVYAVVRAIARGILWQPVEPADDVLFSYLLSLGFVRADIIAWYVLRLLPQYIAQGETIAFDAYLEPFLAELARETKWQDVSYDPRVILDYALGVLKRDITLHSYDRAFAYTDPLAVTKHDNDFTIFNTLSATADVFRDRAMAMQVLRAVQTGKKPMLVCGVAHAVMQEPAYRAYFT